MSDNLEQPEPDAPSHVPASGGDQPVDFFSDAAETSPLAPVSHTASSNPSLAFPSPRLDEAPVRSRFPVVLAALMLGAIALSWYYQGRRESKEEASAATRPDSTSTPSASPTSSAETSPSTTPIERPTPEASRLDARIEELSARIKTTEEKLKSTPASGTPGLPSTDLKPIQTRLDAVAKSVAPLSPLPEALGNLTRRVDGLDESVKSLRDEIALLKGEFKKVGSKTSTREPKTGTEDSSSPPWARGAELFKAGKYQEASDLFRTLDSSAARDARIYYYAALARGSATGDWTGETVNLVTRGIELEKAGSPQSSEVDASFADLPARLKPWLEGYRRRAR
ncbi:MAG: hypothetical protein NVSMB9_03840 [Isosphaeraceae bacterium]